VNSSLPQSGKKLYSTPVIRIYGDIRAITLSNSAIVTNMNDFGAFPTTKT
jgi:hypothetical protein